MENENVAKIPLPPLRAPLALAPESSQSAPESAQEAAPPATETRAPELGPLNIIAACAVVSKKYGASLNTVQCKVPPIIHEGSIADFCLVNSTTPIAQARVRFSPTIVFDKDGNATVGVYFCEITYPISPYTVQIRQ